MGLMLGYLNEYFRNLTLCVSKKSLFLFYFKSLSLYLKWAILHTLDRTGRQDKGCKVAPLLLISKFECKKR